jgi:hypothetical protein
MIILHVISTPDLDSKGLHKFCKNIVTAGNHEADILFHDEGFKDKSLVFEVTTEGLSVSGNDLLLNGKRVSGSVQIAIGDKLEFRKNVFEVKEFLFEESPDLEAVLKKNLAAFNKDPDLKKIVDGLRELVEKLG